MSIPDRESSVSEVKSERALKLAWSNSLGHQIKRDTLPDFALVKGELEALLNKNFMKNG